MPVRKAPAATCGFVGTGPDNIDVVQGNVEWLGDRSGRGEAELRPAGHLWGKPTREVDALLKEELDDQRVQIAQVGPAGER